jgi:hypothetical protein
MTAKSSCPNGRRLLAELERLGAQWEGAQAQLEEARKRIAALEAEVRRGRRSAAPFSRGEPIPGRRPGEEAIQETVEVPLEACPAYGGPLEDRATHDAGHPAVWDGGWLLSSMSEAGAVAPSPAGVVGDGGGGGRGRWRRT